MDNVVLGPCPCSTCGVPLVLVRLAGLAWRERDGSVHECTYTIKSRAERLRRAA